VADLHRRLEAHGLAAGDPPGEFGAGTERALRRWQAANSLPATGICDAATWTRLVEAAFALGARLLCLQRPMLRGDDVADLQLRLSHLGFDPGRIDGIFGPQTEQAVSSFQRNTGLVCDRVAGDDTVEALRQLGRDGELTSVTVVREAERLRTAGRTLDGRTVALGHDGTDLGAAIADEVGGFLRPSAARVSVIEGDWSAQATYCNDLGADVYLGVEVGSTTGLAAMYFGVHGFESLGGRRLAEAIVDELPAVPGWSAGAVAPDRTPILRETRAPAVLLRIGDRDLVAQQHGIIATALTRALERWPDLASTPTD
jgi:N-acetylmuramoyl-L-alanine amidase